MNWVGLEALVLLLVATTGHADTPPRNGQLWFIRIDRRRWPAIESTVANLAAKRFQPN